MRNQHLILEAVLAGEGAGLLTPRFAQAHVASGRLIPACSSEAITAGAYFLAWHENRDDDPLVAVFRSWISEALAAEAPA